MINTLIKLFQTLVLVAITFVLLEVLKLERVASKEAELLNAQSEMQFLYQVCKDQHELVGEEITDCVQIAAQ